MPRRLLPLLAALVVTTLPAWPAHATTTRQVPVCKRAPNGRAGCFAIRVDRVTDGRVQHASTPVGYGPADLRAAYSLPAPPAGAGATVAGVDAYDDPAAEADLATYGSGFGLPACTSRSGCFRKVDQQGGRSYPPADPGWAQEISLDLDMVSAVCPACHILLVEATSSSQANLGAAVNTAVRLGAGPGSHNHRGAGGIRPALRPPQPPPRGAPPPPRADRAVRGSPP